MMAQANKHGNTKTENETTENKSDSSLVIEITTGSASRAKPRPKSEEQAQKSPELLQKRSLSWCVLGKYDNPAYPTYNQETAADEETKEDS